jgi:hypothetical protein
MIKEYGSDFQFLDAIYRLETQDNIQQRLPASRLYFSGRAALYELIKFGIEGLGWKHIFIPEYYCHEVCAFIGQLNIGISYYNNRPDLIDADFAPLDKVGDVILNVSFFGILNDLNFEFKHAVLVEDHTHSISSINELHKSNADYCFASLRKALPVPCGGIVWSPKNLKLPQDVEEGRISESVASMKLSGMKLKTRYLNGDAVSKTDFRNLLLESESHFFDLETRGGLPSFVTDLIKGFSIDLLNRTKTENLKSIAGLIDRQDLLFHSGNSNLDQVLGLVLFFKDFYEREQMKTHLINNSIYPAVLWPGQFANQSKAFSDRVLFIHCDIRHNQQDMGFIAQTINQLK